MTVWGHETVHVVKDVDNKQWIVSTSKTPRQVLVIIPWADAFKDIQHKNAPDYAEALATCQSSRVTALTMAEEAEAREPTKSKAPREPEPKNVISMAAFRKKKRGT